MNNYLRYYLRNALYSLALYSINSTVIQTFLSNLGVPSENIGIYMSASNVINVVVTLLFANLPDKNRRPAGIKNILSGLMSVVGVFFAAYLPFCFINLPSGGAFIPLLVISGLQAAFIAVRNIYEYKLPYQIIEPEKYGMLLSVDGIISGILGLLPGVILSYLFTVLPYYSVMAGCFTLSAAFILLAAVINRGFAVSGCGSEKSNAPACSIISLIKMPVFSALIIPNLLRGAATGVFSMITVIALKEGGFTNETVSYLIIVTSASNLLGSVAYTVLARYIKANTICLCGGIMVLAFMFMTAGSTGLFLAAAFIVMTGVMMINYAIPVIVYDIIPYEIASSYNSLRMILTTAGSAFSMTLTGFLIGKIPVMILLAAAPLCQLVCSAWYYIYYKKSAKRV